MRTNTESRIDLDRMNARDQLVNAFIDLGRMDARDFEDTYLDLLLESEETARLEYGIDTSHWDDVDMIRFGLEIALDRRSNPNPYVDRIRDGALRRLS